MLRVTIPISDFDDLAKSSDQAIVNRFMFYRDRSRKTFHPNRVVDDAWKVQRSQERLTIQLLKTIKPGEHQRVALFSFAPPPAM